MRRGQLELASILSLTGFWLVFAFSTFISGGVRSAPYSGNVLIVLTAAILLGRGGALVYAALSVVQGLGFVWLEASGGMPPLSTTPESALLMQAAYFAVGAGSLYLADISVREALDRAQRELSERQRAEVALRENEQKFRALVEQSSEGLVLADEQGMIMEWNRAQELLSGIPRNAAKFMGDQPHPCIEIGMRGTDPEGLPILYVRDNGIGIAPEYSDRVFGLFAKLDPQSERTGVGLTLVKRIIEVHGGLVWIESEGADKSSTVCFTLPREAATFNLRGEKQ